MITSFLAMSDEPHHARSFKNRSKWETVCPNFGVLSLIVEEAVIIASVGCKIWQGCVRVKNIKGTHLETSRREKSNLLVVIVFVLDLTFERFSFCRNCLSFSTMRSQTRLMERHCLTVLSCISQHALSLARLKNCACSKSNVRPVPRETWLVKW